MNRKIWPFRPYQVRGLCACSAAQSKNRVRVKTAISAGSPRLLPCVVLRTCAPPKKLALTKCRIFCTYYGSPHTQCFAIMLYLRVIYVLYRTLCRTIKGRTIT